MKTEDCRLKAVGLKLLFAFCLLASGCTATRLSARMKDGSGVSIYRVSILQKVALNAGFGTNQTFEIEYGNDGGGKALGQVAGAMTAAGIQAVKP